MNTNQKPLKQRSFFQPTKEKGTSKASLPSVGRRGSIPPKGIPAKPSACKGLLEALELLPEDGCVASIDTVVRIKGTVNRGKAGEKIATSTALTSLLVGELLHRMGCHREDTIKTVFEVLADNNKNFSKNAYAFAEKFKQRAQQLPKTPVKGRVTGELEFFS